MAKSKVKFIDLFAGIGGFHIALHNTIGAECVFVSEWDEPARKTYEANFKKLSPKIFATKTPLGNSLDSNTLFSTPNFAGDITKVEPKDIPDFDILCAGFPCQPFSMAGLKKGFADTRGTLFFQIAEIIKEKQPKVVWLENVKNLRNHDKGNTFKVIRGTLEKLGYTVYDKILNAKNFGLPQNRERIYILGFRNDLDIKDFEFPNELNTPTKVGDILEKNVNEKYTISDRLWEGHQRRKKEHAGKGNGFGYSLFNERSPYTSTISARYYKDGSEILIKQKNKNPRKITPKEASRLQGFPDWFEVVVSDNQAYKQFGNSVAIPVLENIVRQIDKTGVFNEK
ncbi:DNA cytosine methyltransferase [Microgenomates group bacterium]|nr:DNA cytosine methyltransferase [Microgenomates group bacterium]